jgi:DNA-binding Xre family transcriptional regulator
MSVTVGYHWHLRRLMAEAGMFATTDLVPLLAERGVRLSREQVYRLVAQVPQRLSLQTLAALCDILACTPGDLVEPYRANRTVRAARRADSAPQMPRPKRARVLPGPGPGGDQKSGSTDTGRTGR